MISERIRSLGLFSLVFLAACGGASSDDISPASGSLSGRHLFSTPIFDDAWYLDLSTGHYSPVPNLVWGDDENTGCDTGAPLFSVAPVRGSDRLLESRIDCLYTDDTSGIYGEISQFAIRSATGEFIEGFQVILETGEFLYGPARLSPDGEHVAMTGSYNDDPGLYHIQLFSTDGEWLAVSSEDRIEGGNFDWLPDGRLIYASGQTVYIAAAGSASGQTWLTFSKDDGEPGQLAVSPDGRQLALSLVSDRSSGVSVYGDIWIVDLQTAERRRLAYAPEADRLNYPIWSPDGRWIGFLQNVASTAGPLAQAHYYIVPSDGEDIQVTTDGISEGMPLSTWVSDVAPGSPEYSTRSLRTAPIAWLP